MRSNNLLIRVALVCLLFFGAPAAVQAHAFPDHSEPAVGSTLSVPPGRVRIWFTEALEQAFSAITVTDASGGNVGKGKATVDPKDRKLLEINLAPLQPGTYRVKWRAVSVDTHATQGDFTFTVKP